MLDTIFPAKSPIVVALLVTIGIFYVEEEQRGRTAWEEYRATAEKRGVKLFMKDIIPPDVPDSENYAAIPLIRDMFAETKPGVASPEIFAFGHGKRPKLGDFNTGRRADLREWQEFFLTNKLLDARLGDTPRDVLRALGKFEPALQQLRDATPRPRCKFPTKWEKGIAVSLSHLKHLMPAARLFTLRMEALLAAGDSPAALSEFHHAMRLSEALGSEPSLIAGLVRVSQLALVERAIWTGLADHRWSEGDLSKIEEHLRTVRLLDEFQFVIQSERCNVPEFILGLTTKKADATWRAIQGFGDTLGTPEWASYPPIFPKGWIYQNVILMHECYDAVLAPYKAAAESGKPMTIGDAVSIHSWLGAHGVFSEWTGAYYLFVRLGMGVGDTVQRKYFMAHTEWQQTLLGCALEKFHLQHNAFPEKLDELVPKFIAEVPLDIADGKPMRYRRNADGGYDLWSIGEDRKDDGGKFDVQKTASEQADWIWHMPGGAGVR